MYGYKSGYRISRSRLQITFPQPLGNYTFEGNGNDSSGHSRNLDPDLASEGTYVVGKFGQGYQSGADAVPVTGSTGLLPATPVISTKFSIVFWLYSPAFSDDNYFSVGQVDSDGQNGFNITLQANGDHNEVYATFSDSNTFPPISLPQGWHHIGLVSSGNATAAFYIDGVQRAIIPLTGADNYGPVFAINNQSAATVDSLTVVGDTLTATQIANLAAGNQYQWS